VVRCAPRLSPRLVAAIARIDNRKRPIAETYRSVCALAEQLGLTRPSYEQVRTIVHEIRESKRDPSFAQVLLDVDLRRRPPQAIVEALAGTSRPLAK
jgi:hypothetical protein